MDKRAIRKVGVVVKPNNQEAFRTACELSDWLRSSGIEPVGEPCVWSESPETHQDTWGEALAAEAASRKRWEFMLTAAPLPIRGGTGSPLNPIATF